MAKGNRIEDKKLLLKKMIDNRAVRDKFAQEVEKRTEEIKKQLIRKFDSHPVTKEIESGADSNNSSGLLGGTGNLFSFIGFNAGQRPVEAIKRVLNGIRFKNLKRRVKIKGNHFSMDARVEWINMSDIENVSKMPWEPGSWVTGIERGISGLGYYVNMRGRGRSGGGSQSQKKLTTGNFRTTKYLPGMLLEAEKILRTGK